ncbi:amidohydrolase family protein [Romboutsia sedimentorum]|uniref:amidohydrolase family protein n=1 Tax=Romboutsia sedimentorum TaxID=1368474 RepID=UPI0024DE6F74|nr:amidohydrolase family protein [Romboutsia sedimentorum]MDK2585564.1 amidohydrolase family protein [Romboutsia sedimentorum]
MKIIKGNIIFTPTYDKFEIIKDGYIILSNNKIVGVYNEIPKQYKNYELIDYKDKLIIPGMNDLHCHAPQFRNVGIAMDKELLPWLNDYTFPEESKYKDIDYGEKMYSKFVKEIYKNGTTRVAAFATIHKQSTMKLMDILIDAGIGGYVGKVNMDRNSCDSLCEDTLTSINDTLDIIKGYLNKSELVKPIITPRFVPTCSEHLLKSLGEIALKYNLPVQSHLSENIGEINWVKELHPHSKFYGDVYDSYNLFGDTPTLMAHCVHLTDDEINLMKTKNVYAVHCPTSNANLGSGIMTIRKLLNNNVKIAFGSDVSGGHSFSIFKAIVYAIEFSKLIWAQNKEYDFLTLSEAFYIATKGGGSFFGNIGSFEKDYEFDALVIDDSDLNFDNYSLLERLEKFIYLGDDRHIYHRYVSGKLI